MFQDWNQYSAQLIASIGDFSKLSPDAVSGLMAIEGSAAKSDLLGAKVRELIALAVAVTTRCDGCIAVHTRKVVEAGASREEIAEALSVAIALNAGAALTYSARVFDAHSAL